MQIQLNLSKSILPFTLQIILIATAKMENATETTAASMAFLT